MSEPFLGEIRMFGGNFAPRGWALCDGQLLPINQNSALFSILGTTYGGDGRSTFGLPEMRGRFPVSAGSGPGLTDRRLGTRFGSEEVALTFQNLPSHGHGLVASDAGATTGTPAGNVTLAVPAAPAYGPADDDDLPMASLSIGNAGSSAAHPNRSPYQVVQFIIAIQGIFPTRN